MTTMYKQFGGTTTRSDGSDDEDWENDWDSETELPFKDSTGVCMGSSRYTWQKYVAGAHVLDISNWKEQGWSSFTLFTLNIQTCISKQTV